MVSQANLPAFPWTLKNSDEEMDSRWCHDPTIPSSLRAASPLLTEGGEGKGRQAPSRGQKLPEAAACSAVWGPRASGSQGLVGGASVTPSQVEVVPLSIPVGWRPTGRYRREGAREEAREGAVSKAGFIINTGQKEVMPTQGSRGARSFLRPQGLAVLGQRSAAQERLPSSPSARVGTAGSANRKAGWGL